MQSVTESIFTANRHAYLVAIALAVLMLSPVTIRTVMPALWHCLIEAGTSGRTGSWNNIHETTLLVNLQMQVIFAITLSPTSMPTMQTQVMFAITLSSPIASKFGSVDES